MTRASGHPVRCTEGNHDLLLSRVKLLRVTAALSLMRINQSWLRSSRVSLAVLLHHPGDMLTLLLIMCQIQVILLHQRDASLGQIVGDT